MTLLTEFTKEMLLRSTYDEKGAALLLAKRLAEKYAAHGDNAVCLSRWVSLMKIIEELSE